MDWIESYLLSVLAIFACAWVASVALKNVGQFGNADELKKQAFFRTLTSFFGIIVLILLIGARSKDIVNETYFYSLFTAIVVSLGIKLARQIRS